MQRLMDRDLLTALVLFAVGGIAWNAAGDDVKNWIFPLLAIYLILGIAVALVARVVFAVIMEQAPDMIRLVREDRDIYSDVIIFFLIVLAYMFLMYGLGFWLASFLMLTLTSLHLTLDKTPRNVALAIVVPFATCVAAYFIFLRVFYVPFPKATWWAGLG